MAFEIEGRDIGSGQKKSIRRDVEKFEALKIDSDNCYVLLHQIRYRQPLDRLTQASRKNPLAWIRHFGGDTFPMLVKTDADLMAPDGIEGLATFAKRCDSRG